MIKTQTFIFWLCSVKIVHDEAKQSMSCFILLPISCEGQIMISLNVFSFSRKCFKNYVNIYYQIANIPIQKRKKKTKTMEQGCKQNQKSKLLIASKDQFATRNFITDEYRGWNQSQSQNHSKRRLLRKGIRQKHVNQIFKHKREKFKYEEGLGSAKANGSEYLMGQTIISNGKGRGEGHVVSKQDEINELLRAGKLIGNDTIWKIWRIVIESNNQICLGQKSMQRLIECAKSDLSFISNPDCEYSRKKTINQRIGQILWTLLNQTYKSPNISLHTTADIVQLCLQIVRQAPSAQVCPDQYLLGLCIVLLGNICVSQSHVNCILKQVKLSQLLSMVEETGMLQGENCEDLSFFFTNLLFYYPEYRGQSEKDAQSEIEELTKVLNILGHYLEVDLLMNIYALHRLPFRNSQQANNTPLKKVHRSNTKNKYHYDMENRNKKIQGDIQDECLKINQEQLQKIKNRLNTNNRTLDISRLSQNFTNDLMQCIEKIKQIILDLHISHSIPSLSTQILPVSLHPLIFSLLTNSIRLLLLHPAPLPCSLQLKLHNTLLFIRNELRFISQKNISQKHNELEGKFIKNIKDSIIKKGLCERTCGWIRRWVGGNCERYQSNGKGMRIQFNQEMNEGIENCVWQIYGKMLEFLSEADYTGTINVHKKCREQLQKQLSWLESQLTSKNKKQYIQYGQSLSMGDETQGIEQSRIFPLLSEYYPIATIQYQNTRLNQSKSEIGKSMDDSSNRRSSYRVRVSDIQLADCVEYIDVEIGKIADLLQLFCLKLQQYKDCPSILCTCLRSTLKLLNRLNIYLSSLQPTLNIGGKPIFILPPHLQKPLRQIFYTHLSSTSDNTISQQICELIEQILHGKKQQLQMKQEAIEEQREQEVNQDGNGDWKIKYKMEEEKQTNSEEWEKSQSKMQ